MKRRPRVKTAYHHGDLRTALLDEALAIVTRHGPAALSLRELARRLGVTYGAPHHHFAEKDDLFAALAEAAFAELTERVERAVFAAGDVEPLERLRVVGRTYLAFAMTEKARYQVMFLSQLRDRKRFASLHAVGGRALGLLAAGFEVAGVPEEGAHARAVACWATLHGFAVLANEDFLGETERGQARLAIEVIETAVRIAEPSWAQASGARGDGRIE